LQYRDWILKETSVFRSFRIQAFCIYPTTKPQNHFLSLEPKNFYAPPPTFRADSNKNSRRFYPKAFATD
jgi:hypothetical protein